MYWVYGNKPYFYRHGSAPVSAFSRTPAVFLSKQVNRWTRWRTIQSLMGRDIYFTHSIPSLLCTAYMWSPNQYFIFNLFINTLIFIIFLLLKIDLNYIWTSLKSPLDKTINITRLVAKFLFCLICFLIMLHDEYPSPCPPRRCRDGGLDCGSRDPGSIPGIPSPGVGPLMTRRLKTSSDVPVPVLVSR